MAEAFNRKYKLTIGRVGANGTVVLTDQHIEFQVGQTSNSELNTLEVRIYNLSDKTIALLDKKDTPIRLEAGYESGMGLLFNGTKTSSYSYKSGTETITEICAAEGAKEIRESRCSSTQPEGVTLRKVLEDIIKQGFPGYAVNLKGDVLDNKRYNAGASYQGNICSAMDTYCIPNGLEWNILNSNTVNVFPKNGTMKYQQEYVVLSPQSGLIGYPEKATFDTGKLDDDDKNTKESGYRLRSLLNHKLLAATFLKLEGTGVRADGSKRQTSADGTYKIIKVYHSGSFEGDNWTTEVDAVLLR